MKTINAIWAVLIASLLLISCEKEEDTSNQAQNQSVRDKIISFVGNIENTNRNTNSNSYSLEEGLWNVESGISLYRTRVNIQYSNRVKHNFHLKLNTSNGEVTFSDLQNLYFEILDEMQSIWDSYASENKFFNMITVSYNPYSENNVDVKLVFTYGDDNYNRSTNVVSYFQYFDDSDNFIFGAGSYDPCSNPSGINAASAISAAVYYDHVRLQLLQPGAYVINQQMEYLESGMFPNPNDTDAYDNYYQSYLFHNRSNLPNYHMCLPKAETQNYANLAWTLINKSEENGFPLKPTGKQVVDLDLEGRLAPLYDETVIDHAGYVTYGNIEIEEIIHAIGFGPMP